MHESVVRDRTLKGAVLDLLTDAELAFVDDDEDLVFYLIPLLDQHLFAAGLVLLQEAGDLHRRVSIQSFEEGESTHDVEQFLLLFQLLLVHDHVQVSLVKMSKEAELGFDSERPQGQLLLRTHACRAEGVAHAEKLFVFDHRVDCRLVDEHCAIYHR